jgi:hypothetical protein
MAVSFADTARKASAGQWRKPRMKVYDYNQVCRGKLIILMSVVFKFYNLRSWAVTTISP